MNKDWDFDSWASSYDESVRENDWIHENYSDNINLLFSEIDILAKDKKINLLDIGAGTGNLISKLINYHNVDILAIEPSKNMRDIFQKKCQSVEIIDAKLPVLPNINKKFDVIVASYVIHHVEHEKASLKMKLIVSNNKV
jgi:ubiquinone/menaquinone biosynthesis C-methylase UbiE